MLQKAGFSDASLTSYKQDAARGRVGQRKLFCESSDESGTLQ
jgi:hypothetical protein